MIELRGAVAESSDLPLSALSTLPRREIAADFHCVAGWSATDLRWEGVPFAEFHRRVITPALLPGTNVTHIACAGLDGWQSVMTIEDALADDVLIAQHLDDRPLDGDHGHFSVKHLARITVLTEAPVVSEGPRLRSHPRGRVWEEERHGLVRGRLVRPIYRTLVAPITFLCARGARPGAPARH